MAANQPAANKPFNTGLDLLDVPLNAFFQLELFKEKRKLAQASARQQAAMNDVPVDNQVGARPFAQNDWANAPGPTKIFGGFRVNTGTVLLGVGVLAILFLAK